MLDAPVSGGVPAAANASLTFIVGGTEEGLVRARPLLTSMGTKVVHCGEAGNGCVAKVMLPLMASMFCFSRSIGLIGTNVAPSRYRVRISAATFQR